MTISCLTQLYTSQGLLTDADGDGLPDGFRVRFIVGRTPGAIDVAARLGLESAALTPGFTEEGPGIPLVFGPDNPACPETDLPPDCGLVALTPDGIVVTGATPDLGWMAARWLASTFPFVRPGGPLLEGPAEAVLLRDGAVVSVRYRDGAPVAMDKETLAGPPGAAPFPAKPVGDLPPAGPAQLFTVAGLMGSSDEVQHDRAGWQVTVTLETSPEEIAALCELAARTGVEATGLRFPLAVTGEATAPAVVLADCEPTDAAWAEGGLAWAPDRGLIAFGTPAERAAALRRAAEEAGLVQGLHATLFTARAALPAEPVPPGETVFDLVLEQAWEVDRFRAIWHERVLPEVKPGEPVLVDLRLSEPLSVREPLAEEIIADLAARQVSGAQVRVLSAYKQGFHWLEEEALPTLLEMGSLSRVHVAVAPFTPGDGALEMEIRWLQELYPADELLSRSLGVPVAFDMAPEPGEAIYRLTAYGPNDEVLHTESFSPVCAERLYLPDFPNRGRVHPPTGLLRVQQGEALLCETAIDTDPEAFWTAYQEQVLPRLGAHLGGRPDPARQPFFGALVVEVALSEEDRRLGIREEQISPLDALHEDIYFYTLDYLNELGLSLTGKPFAAPGAVEPWVTCRSDGGPRARIRLLGLAEAAAATADTVPAERAAMPEPAGQIPADQVIGPDQLPEYLAYLATLPGVSVWRAGLSTGGRPTWAVSVTAPTAGRIAPPQKLSAWRPTLLINGRRHANEVSSTNAILMLAERAAREGLAGRVNLFLSPMENVDGAALHYAMQQVHPTWKLHAARFNAAGVDFGYDCFAECPRFGESRTLPTLWRAALPDVVLDDHGYPSHEWVQPFSGYNSPPYFRTSWWMPNALIYGIHRWMDEERFPQHAAVQAGLRGALARRLTANVEIETYTRMLLDRYVTYGQRHVPEKFPLEQHEGWVSLTRPAEVGAEARTFVGRFPHITLAELITEVPDETAQGEYLSLCARAHLEGDLAVLEYLSSHPQPVVRRRWEPGDGTVLWTVGRSRCSR